MTPHSSTLAWKIPWMEEPGRLQSTGSQRVRHDWSDLAAAAGTKGYLKSWSSDRVHVKEGTIKPRFVNSGVDRHEHTGTDIKITTDVVMQPDFFGVSETASVVLSLLMQKWLETHLWDSWLWQFLGRGRQKVRGQAFLGWPPALHILPPPVHQASPHVHLPKGGRLHVTPCSETWASAV